MYQIGEIIEVNSKRYQIVKAIGKGKGGYSFLALLDGKYYTLKQIHHEPCSYYSFGNKIEAEQNDYQRLAKLPILLPKLIEIDFEKEIIIKEYIDGETISSLLEKGEDVLKYIGQLESWLPTLYRAGLNIDYYPTTFIVKKEEDRIYYIDYECNQYHPEWDFETWGKGYWTKEKPIS